ncbi:MAG: LysM domain-containing protein, partial [Myxococcota bacterium]
ELLMQFHLFHTVQVGGSYSKISRRYYRTIKFAAMLKEYNAADMLKPGQRLVIPIFDRSTLDAKSRKYVAGAAKPGALSRPAPVKPSQKTTSEEAHKRLQSALSKYYAGNFDQACGDLDSLLLRPPRDKRRLFQHLGFCAIAKGDNNAARDYFRNWIELDPAASLNPIDISPKIRRVFDDVANEARPKTREVETADGAKK